MHNWTSFIGKLLFFNFSFHDRKAFSVGEFLSRIFDKIYVKMFNNQWILEECDISSEMAVSCNPHCSWNINNCNGLPCAYFTRTQHRIQKVRRKQIRLSILNVNRLFQIVCFLISMMKNSTIMKNSFENCATLSFIKELTAN
jgi:hypothetical protein